MNKDSSAGNLMCGADLLRLKLPPLRWVVPGLLPEGGALLAGRPKSGKSWLSLQLAVSLAVGRRPWGDVDCGEHPAMYLSLEDGLRRLQWRVRKLWGEGWEDDLKNIHFATEWPRGADAVKAIDSALEKRPGVRLVVVDTLTRTRVRTPMSRQNPYEIDYDAVAGFSDLGQRRGVGVLIVHHTRKPNSMEDEDPFDTISGTSGLTGAVDTMLVLKRPHLADDASLHVRGRDTEEKTVRLSWDETACLWKSAPPAALPPEQAKIVEYLNARSDGGGILEMTASLNKNYDTLRMLLRRMEKEGKVFKKDGRYRVCSACSD